MEKPMPMHEPPIKAVLFDLDGTPVDSERAYPILRRFAWKSG